jgi:hypothetical protein
MPTPASRKKTTARKGQSRLAARRAPDAIALLKADHRQVESWFEQFDKARSAERKQMLSTRICQALKLHTEIEEALFYPAFLEATGDKDKHHEAIVEHAGAKRLIEDIEGSSPEDDFYDAKVTVLSEMIAHHVREEEQPGGLFAEARKSGMDLLELGRQLQARRKELQARPAGKAH